MELKHLRTFVTAVEQSSFTDTGNRLAITQAAVSQHIAALERELGTVLFDRTHRAITVTETGLRLYEYAFRILELVDEAAAAVKGEGLCVQGDIRIAASTVPAELVLPRLLARFREIFPQVKESIVVSDSQAATRAVANCDADIGFVGEEIPSQQLEFRSIADDELLMIVSPAHEWAGKQSVTPRSLVGQPLIVREPGSGSRHCVESALQAKGIDLEQLNLSMEVNSNDAIRAAVEQNAGIAFLSATTVASELEQSRLVQVRVKGVKPKRKLFLVTRRRATLPRAVREFIQFVISTEA